MSKTESLKIPKHVAWRRVEDEIVVLDLETSVYYSLNSVATRIWELVAEGKDLEAVSGRILEEYDVSEKRVLKDAQDFIKTAKKEKILAAG